MHQYKKLVEETLLKESMAGLFANNSLALEILNELNNNSKLQTYISTGFAKIDENDFISNSLRNVISNVKVGNITIYPKFKDVIIRLKELSNVIFNTISANIIPPIYQTNPQNTKKLIIILIILNDSANCKNSDEFLINNSEHSSIASYKRKLLRYFS